MVVSIHWKNKSKNPLPVHHTYTAGIRDAGGDGDLPKNCIKFIRDGKDSKDPKLPKYYSFSSDEGMISQVSDYVLLMLT